MHPKFRTARRLLIAVPVVAALLVAGTGSASAMVVDPLSTGITLDTTITFNHGTLTDSLDIVATGDFTTSFTENTTIALQVVGTQTWTDATGTHTAPIEATPSSVRFASANTVEAFFYLQPNAVVQVSYTAEDAGFAPTPFTGSCAGTGVQLSPGESITSKTC